MASFLAKIGWKRMRKRENKKLSLRFVPTRCVIENSKKITKKFKKIKNTNKNSFQAKIGWKKMRKRATKIIVPFYSVPTRCVIENTIKIVKKSKKKKRNTIMVHFKPKQVGKG